MSFKKEGYESATHGLIPYDADLQNIPPSVMRELNDKTASSWSLFLINRNIEEIKKLVSPYPACPADTSAIREIVKEEINRTPKRIRDKVIPIIKDLTIIGTLIILALKVFGVITIT